MSKSFLFPYQKGWAGFLANVYRFYLKSTEMKGEGVDIDWISIRMTLRLLPENAAKSYLRNSINDKSESF